MAEQSIIQRIRNQAASLFGVNPINPQITEQDTYMNLAKSIAPVQLQRLRHDVQMWREAVAEAELAYYPHRVRMQRMFIDTILNGHVGALMERRKDLTLLRDFEVLNPDGSENEDLEHFLEQEWFDQFVSYTLDALFFGYSLISMGDIVDSKIKNPQIIKRWHISPDREHVTRFVYAPNGVSFLEEPYSDWHVWVTTPSETGHSKCGYGLLYKIALYEIFLRNTLGYNGDFVELYAMPYRVGKTTKTNEEERAMLEQALRNMGSAGYAIVDPTDEIEFLETALGGSGWKGYENLEQRCQKIVSKIILGHADAVDSVPGKLGNSAEESPAQQALEDKQVKDGKFVENIVNGQLFPKLRNLGFPIPEGVVFCFSNNHETEENTRRENENSKLVAEIAQTMKNAGLKMDPLYFREKTGIEITVGEGNADEAAQAELRGSVGGVTGIIQLQQSVSNGLTTPEAAIATLKYVYGFDEAKAKEMVAVNKKENPEPAQIGQTGITESIKAKLNKIYG